MKGANHTGGTGNTGNTGNSGARRQRIAFWTRLPFGRELLLAEFGAREDIEFVVCGSLQACIDALPGTDGMLLYNAPPTDARPLLQAIRDTAPTLRWLHFLTAGREGFDAVGIPEHLQVTQTEGASAPVVAEHAMALLLALGRRVPELLAQAAQHRWDRGIAARLSSLEGKTVAILGYGQIGSHVARRAQAFGARTLALSRTGKGDAFADEALPLDALLPALARSDALVIAIALAPQTRHLIDAAALAACKPGLLLVNVARGAVVEAAALRDALHSGHIAGAGLDVTDPEPPAADDLLWDCPNLIVSPHVAAEGSPATHRRLADGAMQQLNRFIEAQQDKHA